MGCLSWHKDTNFKANHNDKMMSITQRADVCLGTKIRILKQITTYLLIGYFLTRCLSWHKDTNFKANHNKKVRKVRKKKDVCLGTKIRILKQITTKQTSTYNREKMFVLAQRYEF